MVEAQGVVTPAIPEGLRAQCGKDHASPGRKKARQRFKTGRQVQPLHGHVGDDEIEGASHFSGVFAIQDAELRAGIEYAGFRFRPWTATNP